MTTCDLAGLATPNSTTKKDHTIRNIHAKLNHQLKLKARPFKRNVSAPSYATVDSFERAAGSVIKNCRYFWEMTLVKDNVASARARILINGLSAALSSHSISGLTMGVSDCTVRFQSAKSNGKTRRGIFSSWLPS